LNWGERLAFALGGAFIFACRYGQFLRKKT
jgi:hypothetical protein